MAERTDGVWKAPELAAIFLDGVRGAIPLAEEQIEVMVRLIAASGPVGRFLDLGCGNGILSAAILDRFSEARGVLVDFSASMREAAAANLKRHAGRVRFVDADFGEASWLRPVAGDGPYDAIVSGYSIHHQTDSRKRKLYGEIHRLLQFGGIFVNVEHVSSASAWVAGLHDELFVDSLHRLHSGKSRREVEHEYYRRPDKAANILAPVEFQCQWLRQIGFVDVDCYLKIFELAVFGGRRRQRVRRPPGLRRASS